jgi:hypothetical protein
MALLVDADEERGKTRALNEKKLEVLVVGVALYIIYQCRIFYVSKLRGRGRVAVDCHPDTGSMPDAVSPDTPSG